jgi:PBP1b-binding outer membrane lipoprotein LpoB
MNVSNRLLSAQAVLLAVFLSGCAPVQMASRDQDASAKTFKVAPNKSNIFVYRCLPPDGGIPIQISLDGKVAGKTSINTYFLFEVDPGSHEIVSAATNRSSLKLNTEAGRSYFISQQIADDSITLIFVHADLRQVADEPAARKDLARCHRAQAAF